MSDFIIGLTGGVASGKSEVTRRFEALGVHVADADVIARAVVEPGQPALAAIVARFGAEVLLDDGRPHALGTPAQVLRPELLKAVFGLDVLVQPHPELGHPLVIAR